MSKISAIRRRQALRLSFRRESTVWSRHARSESQWEIPAPCGLSEAAPQPLDEDVVHVATLAIHADGDRVALQGVGEIVAGELAALCALPLLRQGELKGGTLG